MTRRRSRGCLSTCFSMPIWRRRRRSLSISDAYLRPALADAGDDPRHLLDAAGTGVDVGRAQFGGQQMPAAEHIERQIAVVVVIAVEETLFLMPVQRVVGGVEIESDLRRRSQMGIEKQVDKQPLDRR